MATSAGAQSPPKAFAAGDAKAGKALSDKDCVACHARRFEGKPDEMYLRADRRVRTPEQLIAQIGFCNSQLGTHYFPEEEEHVAAYLNLQYYKFKP
jgi:mono/diheme cytochrome c family protein